MPDETVSNQSTLALKALRELIVKRSSIKGQITKFKNYLLKLTQESELTSVQLAELSLRLSRFESLSIKFDDLQSQIEVINSQNISSELDERDDFEQDFISAIVSAKNLVDTNSKACSSHDDTICHRDHQDSGLKLPQIQIAKFDGAYFRWLEFRDTFENLIHNNDRLTPIQKFHYLISYLTGEAARIISNLEVSSVNYDQAWSLLCNRYNNKRVLINHHLNSLFSLRPLPRESEKSLRYLVDHVTMNLRALSSLDQPTDKWDILIIYILTSKLDSLTLTKWEEYRNNLDADVPTLSQFYKFIIDRADVLESINRNKHDINPTRMAPTFSRNYPISHNQKQDHVTKSFASVHSKQGNHKSRISFSCIICNGNHKIYDCNIFKAKSIEDRLAEVAKYKLCSNCLRQGHPVSECRMGPCRDCNKRHNSLLHKDSAVNNSEGHADVAVNFSKEVSAHVILSTAIIKVTNPKTKKYETVRALLDCGSQSSFVSKSLCDKLLLTSNTIDTLKIIGIGNNGANVINESCNIQISSLNTHFNVVLSCYVLQDLTGYLPKTPIDIQAIRLPKDIKLADPTFYQPAKVDVLIGADVFWDILGNEQRSLGSNKPKLRSSKLGWLISGPMGSLDSKANNVTHCNHVSVTDEQENINAMLTKFWNIENVPSKKILSNNDKYCERHFLTNTTRDEFGRFSVKLPLIDTPDCLGDTYKMAKRRFLNLEKRFRKNPKLKLEYAKFIQEYGDLGHLSQSSVDIPSDKSYFLCHHAVYKEDSESTKLRVVFDGSAPSSSGYSLNDILMVGPNVQDSLFSILLRARQYKFLLTGDIEKMYRQVSVNSEDRDLQLILWREDESQPIHTLKLNTLTYGTASASYLSTRCLMQLGDEQDNKEIQLIIQKDFYVDDLITGANNKEMLLFILNSVKKTLSEGCFNLRKLKSNLPTIFDETNLNAHGDLIISESTNTLGLGWTPSTDTFHFPVKGYFYDNEAQATITKRTIMSKSFRLFDPLGLLSPVVVQPKILLQKLWQLKIDWDEPVPHDIKDSWNKFASKLDCLKKLHVPRLVLCDSAKLIELHSFSDASQCAYGACIYMRSLCNNNEVTVKLLCAKSKVAPLKPTTIPRLELCAALLAAELSKSVLDALRFKPDKITHWVDSTIVLSWIKSDLSKLKSFVANRISEIVDTTDAAAWRYVPTELNPADLISRGVQANDLVSTNLWWLGPAFLLKPESEWPVLALSKCEGLPEVKSNTAVTFAVEPVIDFERFSQFNRLQRAFAYCKRFIHNLKNPKHRRVGILTAEEISESFDNLCIIAQAQSFSTEHELLTKNKPLSAKSRILSLSPFLDEQGVIKVGGRLDASNYTYEKRHPILLHANHRLTKLYFEWEHLKNMHAGPQLLLAIVRDRIWPINGRHLARSIVFNCKRCKRVRGKTLCPKMGDLPSNRINPDFPFLSVGLDFAGPFYTVNRKGRGSRLVKSYLCLFVCLRYKCVHLEAVSDLSKDAFIMTFRRFVSRRGKPIEVLCDNGRNFVAAAKDIETFLKANIEPLTDFASQQAIQFKFIPTYTPHFGGIWEAGVKSAKYHVRRVVGNSHLTFEELSTLFAQVESILNSRPLYPLSCSPNDFLALSPGHFLIGRPLTALPAPALEEYNEGSLNRYARLEKIRQHFWQRWQTEYVAELQQRTKWKSNMDKINIGDLVLLKEDNTRPLCWRLGRIVRLFPGPDGVSRVADVNTIRGCERRSLVRLCPLLSAST